jgi:CHAT domain-containing protein
MVLLACMRGLAAVDPGAEALSGLARVFFCAEAGALLVSHWSVDSEPATRLTTSTFAIIKADPKPGRAAALRNAMLTYMNDKEPLNSYPAWAPFSLHRRGSGEMRGRANIGNWQTIDATYCVWRNVLCGGRS